MKTKPENPAKMAGDIEATEVKLHELEEEIDEIGGPASTALRSRLNALKIEEHALRRNFAEIQSARRSNTEKMKKIEALLHHIENEESSLEHEADFLHQASPTTLELAYRGGTRLFGPVVRRLKKAKGDHQFFWHSPFVNNTHKSLAARFTLPPSDE